MVRKTPAPEKEVIEEDTVECAADSTEATAVAMPEKSEVEAIIRKRVYAAVGVGFIPLPLVDLAALTAVQLEMIYALSKAYGIEFKKDRVKSIITSLCGGAATVASVPMISSLFKSIPIIGLPAGAASISIAGGASTYAIGWVFERHFRQGGTLCDFDVQEAKETFKAKVQEGKDFVSKMKPKKKTDDADIVQASDVTDTMEEVNPA